MTPRLLITIAVLLVAQAAFAQVPDGPQLRVNTYTTGGQGYPRIGMASDGDFVVVWHSAGSAYDDTADRSIQGQRYASDGNPVAAEFQVNSHTPGRQWYPSLAVAPDGRFVVAWESYTSAGSDTDGRSIHGQLYASDGSPVNAELEVNTYTTGEQFFAEVAMAPDGGFVVVWHSVGSADDDTAGRSIQGRRYASDGSALGSQFQVNTLTTGHQVHPAVAVGPAGDFVVVWGSDVSTGSDTAGYSVQGQRYASDGGTLGSQFQVNTYTTSSQGLPEVAMDPDGNFAVVWQSNGSAGSDSSDNSVQGQRFFSDGSVRGGEFQVNTYTADHQGPPRVAVDADGDFVVVWRSQGSSQGDIVDYSIQGQRYSSAGGVLGSQFQVNTYTTGDQIFAAAAMESENDFVVVWQSRGSDNGDPSTTSVQAQRFRRAEIAGRVWHDGDGDGIQDGGEPGLENVTVTLRDFNGTEVDTAMTDSEGSFDFPDQPEGTYSLEYTAPADFAFTLQDEGDDALDSDADPDSGQTATFFFGLVMTDTSRDAGLVETGSAGGTVWFDTDFDGVQDMSEPGIKNVRVNLYQDAVLVASTDTDVDGNYGFEKRIGEYHLEFEPPLSYAFTPRDVGSDDTIDSDADVLTGQTIEFTIQHGVTDFIWDAGLANGVGDRVWQDLDGNGLQDGGEPGVENVTVTLRDSVGTQVEQTSTDVYGHFSFVNFVPGDYYLDFIAPVDFDFTAKDQGGAAADAFDSDVNPGTGTTPIFSFEPGDLDRNWDAGLVAREVLVGNRVWLDVNQNGIQDGGEPGVEGILVELHQTPTPPSLLTTKGAVSTTTDVDGFYSFSANPGAYYLQFDCPEESWTTANQGDDATDSDVEPTTQTTLEIALVLGVADGSWDGGLVDPDADGVVCVDNCPADANADQTDSDGDGSGDVCDLCTGDDATGDSDGDGTCADLDCDDADATNACHVFSDGFASGTTSAWSATIP